ncbi:uncharacterized protein TNCV_1921001 [Trichonephila clavipes]|nr:uncharacterized protein TNCV_1921001 [Trichonephila clavipes]
MSRYTANKGYLSSVRSNTVIVTMTAFGDILQLVKSFRLAKLVNGLVRSRVISTGSSLTLRRAKSITSTYTGKSTTVTQKNQEPWKAMGNLDHCGSYTEAPGESQGLPAFAKTIGHDFLGVYIHWLGLSADEPCPLCGHGWMDGDHLLQYTGLDEYPLRDSALNG